MDLETLIWSLEELADKSRQEKLWLGEADGEMSSFDEAVCGVFDDSGLGDILDSDAKRATLSQDIRDKSEELRKLIGRVPRAAGPQALIDSSEMEDVRTASLALLRALRQ